MAKKIFLRDENNVKVLPITRGELVLDSSGNPAFHSNEFLATDSQPGLMSPADKQKLETVAGNTVDTELSNTSTNPVQNKVLTQIINSIREKYLKSAVVSGNKVTITDQSNNTVEFVNSTYQIVTNAVDGLVPKYDAVDGTIDAQTTDWVLTNHNGTLGWYKLPTAAFSSSSVQLFVGAKSTSNNNNSNSATTNGNTYLKLFDNSTLKNQYNIKGTGLATVISDASGTITINVPTSHNQASSDINSLTGYSKATAVAAIATTDSLNSALGKLELKADTTYELVKGAYDGDGTIENLAEILKVLEGISDTETIQAIVGKYLPLTGGMMSGNITFDVNRMIRWHQSDSYSISCPTGNDGAYLLLKAHNGITAKKRLSIYTNAESLPNTNYNLYTDGSLYANSGTFGSVNLGSGDLNFKGADPGDIAWYDADNKEKGRIYYDGTALALRHDAGTTYKILHTGNAYISNGTITINGVSITPLTSIPAHGIHWENFTKRATSSATWGTLTSAKGYTPIFWLDSVNGGGVAFSDYNGKTYLQIDGDYYANEGASLVLHTANYNSYAPTLTGTGATGTWGINISGNADTVDNYHATSFAIWRGDASTDSTATDTSSTSTADFFAKINATSGLFNSRFGAMRGSWWYVGNTQLNTGVGTLEMAGTAVLNLGSYADTNDTYKSLLFLDQGGRLWSYTANETAVKQWSRYAKTSDIPNPANYYWANVKVSASSSTSTQPTFNTCYTSNWFRSTGATGWYNETYTGGIYMEDSTWVRTYNGKSFYCSAAIQAGSRFYTGYDSGVTNSVSCSNWFRSSGDTGWYNASYDGGWYMSDSTWVRSYNSKGVVAGGYYHTSYGSSAYALTSDGGAAHIGSMSVNYANSAGSATNATNASNVYINTSATSSYCPVPFVTSTGAGNKALYIDSSTGTASSSAGVRYNPSSNALYCSGGFFEYSDETAKIFFNDIAVNFDSLKRIPKKYFVWKDSHNTALQIGTSAQKLQEMYPELVTTVNGKLAVSYEKLSVVALKAIDELYDMIVELRQELNYYKTK